MQHFATKHTATPSLLTPYSKTSKTLHPTHTTTSFVLQSGVCD